MTGIHFTALLPIIILAVFALAVMLLVAFRRHHGFTMGVSVVGLLCALAALPIAGTVVPQQIGRLLVVDGYALFFMGLLMCAGIAAMAFCYRYIEQRAQEPEELYLLLLLATLGGLILVSSRHFVTLFIGLELISVSLFPLIAYPRQHRLPLEAAVKYLILSGVSSGFLLFGMALLYAALGTMVFSEMASLLANEGPLQELYITLGLGMVLVGLGFKLAVVPFHLWTPDVYEGAPAPVTAFLATVSKGAVLVLLFRYLTESDAYVYDSIANTLGLIAIASMLIGNLLALLQDNLKRILAYSSIAHLGYLLVVFLATQALAVEAISYYLVAYFVTTLGAFGIVTLLSQGESEQETVSLGQYRGLFWRRPWVAGSLTAMLLSLAGIPITMGFVGKFYIFAAGVEAGLWLLIGVMILGSAIGLYYYLRVIAVMYYAMPLERGTVLGPTRSSVISSPIHIMLVLLTVLLIWLGIYPAGLIDLIRSTSLSFV